MKRILLSIIAIFASIATIFAMSIPATANSVLPSKPVSAVSSLINQDDLCNTAATVECVDLRGGKTVSGTAVQAWPLESSDNYEQLGFVDLPSGRVEIQFITAGTSNFVYHATNHTLFLSACDPNAADTYAVSQVGSQFDFSPGGGAYISAGSQGAQMSLSSTLNGNTKFNETKPSTTTGLVFGVSDPDLAGESSATQLAQLKQMASIGITSVRIEVNQEYVQYNGAGTFDWSQVDTQVKNILAAGMTPEMIIDGSAAWDAVGGSSSGYAQPLSAADFAAWASAVVSRYGSSTKVFEIWNEENASGFWQPAANPSVYTQDLIAAYKSIKIADPSATVISGGLAPESNDGSNINGITFLQDMYADGAKGSFDAVGYHPYSNPALPNTYESWSGWSQMSQTSPSIRSVMVANGDSAKNVWITEVGNESGGPDGIGLTGEATEFTQAIADAKATSWIASLYIYSWQDEGTDATNDEDWYGLLTHAGAVKPAYTAVVNAIK